jgi:hypothetical protein
MTATARPATGEPTVLATYECDEGTRQLVGQRIDGRVALSDVPAGDQGKVYLIERHPALHGRARRLGRRLPHPGRPTRPAAVAQRLDPGRRMRRHHDTPRSLEQQLLEQPRRIAGIDSHRQPVRLGERDTDGHIVGYIDEQGLAWESLAERIVALHGGDLAEALALPYEDPRRDPLMDEVLADVPDELIGDVAQEAAGQLWLRGQRPL